ncbi:MAG TPA: MarR family transcriptional regulator [Microlunatus sp.]
MTTRNKTSRASNPGDAAATHRDPAGVDRFVEQYASTLVEAGVPRMPSRVLACLTISEDGAMTSADLSARLQISPAAVSGAIRYLTQVRMVVREREPGTRRDLYRVQQNGMYAAITGRDDFLQHWRQILLAGVDAVGADTAAGERLTENADFMDFLSSELSGVLHRWEAYRTKHRRP